MTMKPVWIIDDDRSIRWVLEKALTRESIDFKSFGSADEALAELATEAPQVIVSDIRMPGESGLKLLQQAKEQYPQLPVIIMTAYSDLESAVAAFQGGAYEYLPKPFDVDHALELIRRALAESVREDGVVESAEAVPEILGQAPAMQEVFRISGRLSYVAATVNPDTRTVRVRMDLPNPGRDYKPAMFATVLIKGPPQRRNVVPTEAVVRVDNKDHVFVQSGAGIVYDSVPENEQQECINKAKAIVRAAEDAIRFAVRSKKGGARHNGGPFS